MLHIVPAQEGASEAPLNASIHVEILMRAFEELKLHLSTQLMTQLCGLDTHDLGIGATAVQAQNSATARGEAGHGGGDAAYAHWVDGVFHCFFSHTIHTAVDGVLLRLLASTAPPAIVAATGRANATHSACTGAPAMESAMDALGRVHLGLDARPPDCYRSPRAAGHQAPVHPAEEAPALAHATSRGAHE